MEKFVIFVAILSLVCVFMNNSIFASWNSESNINVFCSIARAHSRTTSAVIFLLTTGGVVYLLLRQVTKIVASKIKVGTLIINPTYD